jgi:hypothetical protein
VRQLEACGDIDPDEAGEGLDRLIEDRAFAPPSAAGRKSD